MKAKITDADIHDNSRSYDVVLDAENGGSHIGVTAYDKDCDGQVDEISVNEGGHWVKMASLDNGYARAVSSAVTKFNEGLDGRISYAQRLFDGREDGMQAQYEDNRLGFEASVWNEKQKYTYHVPVYEKEYATWTEALGGALSGGLGALSVFRRGDDHREPIGYEIRERSPQVLSATDYNRDGYCDYVQFTSDDGVTISLYGGYGKDSPPSLDGNLMSARYYLDHFHFTTPTS